MDFWWLVEGQMIDGEWWRQTTWACSAVDVIGMAYSPTKHVYNGISKKHIQALAFRGAPPQKTGPLSPTSNHSEPMVAFNHNKPILLG